jgi:hypothetical protein
MRRDTTKSIGEGGVSATVSEQIYTTYRIMPLHSWQEDSEATKRDTIRACLEILSSQCSRKVNNSGTNRTRCLPSLLPKPTSSLPSHHSASPLPSSSHDLKPRHPLNAHTTLINDRHDPRPQRARGLLEGLMRSTLLVVKLVVRPGTKHGLADDRVPV